MTPSTRRWLAAARLLPVLAAVLAGACSALDDFTSFTFVDGGTLDGGSRADLAATQVGDACTVGGCGGGLTCFTTVGNTTFPGGLCSRGCGAGEPSCPTGSSCAPVDGTPLCLHACNPVAGSGCRSDWSCCDGQRVVVGPGLCAPTSSNFCGG